MNVKPFFAFLILFIFLSAPCVFASFEASVDVSAQYGSSLLDSDADSTSSLVMPAEGHALAGSKPDAYAQSDGMAYLDGHVYGFTAGFGTAGNSIYAQSQASGTTRWLVQSDTLPVGTPVQIWMEVLFEGQFYSEDGLCTSSAQASLRIDGSEVYQGSASFANSALSTDGAWWIDYFSKNGNNAYDLYCPQSIAPFVTAVGETIDLTLFLQTAVECTGSYRGGARTDFSSSGGYTFVAKLNPDSGADLDVNMVMVPEPASILLLSLGTLLLRKHD